MTRRRTAAAVLAGIVALLARAGCGAPTASGTTPHGTPATTPARAPPAAATVGAPSITDGWVRQPPSPDSTVAYLTVHNGGTELDALTGVRTTAADTAELHTNQPGAPGAEVMVSIPRLAVPAGATVALRTGGPHIMLMQPHPQVQPGRRIAVELDVDRAGPVTVQLPVLARDQEPTAAGTTGPGMPGDRECDERGRHPTAQPSADPARLPRP